MSLSIGMISPVLLFSIPCLGNPPLATVAICGRLSGHVIEINPP